MLNIANPGTLLLLLPPELAKPAHGSAAWSLYQTGDPAAEDWGAVKALAVLADDSDRAAAEITAEADAAGLESGRRSGGRHLRPLPGKQARPAISFTARGDGPRAACATDEDARAPRQSWKTLSAERTTALIVAMCKHLGRLIIRSVTRPPGDRTAHSSVQITAH
jgi:hypothetical protein